MALLTARSISIGAGVDKDATATGPAFAGGVGLAAAAVVVVVVVVVACRANPLLVNLENGLFFENPGPGELCILWRLTAFPLLRLPSMT